MEQWDFSGDEVFFFFAAAIIAIWGTFKWYLPLLRATRLGDDGSGRLLLAATPLVGLAGLYLVLSTWADPQYVVGHFDYILLFMAGGAAWMHLTTSAIRWLGIDVRDDAIDRRNLAAAVVICGGLLGTMAIYAACNVGSGPTIWTTVGPAAIASGAWLAMWLIIELTTNISEQIVIDRDLASAIRHAGWALAAGLVLGRAMAGDFTAWESTVNEFIRLGWPAAAITAAVIPLHRAMRPTPTEPQRSIVAAGAIPAFVVLVVAVGYIFALGPADIGKHVITYEEYTGQE